MSAPATESTPVSADPVAMLAGVLQAGIVAALGESFRDADPVIKPSQNPQFGDLWDPLESTCRHASLSIL